MSKEEKKAELSKIEIMRHSVAHIAAAAVLEMFPEAKFAIGPAIENGFYYDFELPRTLIPEDLPLLEEKIREIIKANYPFEKKMMPADEAIEHFEKLGQKYKVELIKDLKAQGEDQVMIYKCGHFVDLCSGPHLESTGEVDAQAFKLTQISGAYWRGDEKREQLQRVYGVAFGNKKELKKYLKMMEEAEKRDHRKLGKELDLFSVSEKVGPGLILWHPKLAKVREEVEMFWRKFHRQRGYDTIYTPHIGRSELWETSGHLDFFKDSMYSPMDIEGEDYYVKPMNCPFHVEIYKSQKRSWREFPFRWNELGTVYRYEKSGELSGMLRVRGFTQDDAHVICREDQFVDEYREVLQFTLDMFSVFGFKKEDIKAYIAVRDLQSDKYAGSDEIWKKAEEVVQKVIKEFKIPSEVEEGGAKFYGPSIDLKVRDSIGREWQLTTIQLDFNLPEKFKMEFVGPEKIERPIMIHRALLGSLERFFAILIEHYAGAFPVWLSPVQAAVLPVSEKFEDYAKKVTQALKEREIRVELYNQDEGLGKRIALASNQKIPYILVVGEKEQEVRSVAVRSRRKKEQEVMEVDDFVEKVLEDVKEKR